MVVRSVQEWEQNIDELGQNQETSRDELVISKGKPSTWPDSIAPISQGGTERREKFAETWRKLTAYHWQAGVPIKPLSSSAVWTLLDLKVAACSSRILPAVSYHDSRALSLFMLLALRD